MDDEVTSRKLWVRFCCDLQKVYLVSVRRLGTNSLNLGKILATDKFHYSVTLITTLSLILTFIKLLY